MIKILNEILTILISVILFYCYKILLNKYYLEEIMILMLIPTIGYLIYKIKTKNYKFFITYCINVLILSLYCYYLQ